MTRRMTRASARSLLLALVISIAACGDDPMTVEFQVIEEVDFAESLNVDLDAMTRLGSGVYVEDLVEGTGEPAVYGKTLTITYTGWLTDGTEFVSRTFSFFMGNDQVPVGLEGGLLSLQVGGTRRIIVPPGRAYGGLPQVGEGGVSIPGGSVLVYVATLDDVQ